MVGTTLAQYRIESLLGSGGMGIVYRAYDTRLHRTVAIKVLQSLTGDDRGSARLLNEARSASGLNHASICTVYEVGDIDGHTYIVMEYVEGQPLSRLIAPGDGLPLEQTLRYATQIADGLAHAHDRAVVHRDLKCANVVITGEGRAKILDFGIARRDRTLENVGETATMTSSEEVELAGTPRYMAPELLRGDPSDARSDLWALGVMLYEMAAGERPFDASGPYELASAILRDPPTPLPARVPATLGAVIARCLTKDPAQRYQRAGEVKAALEAIVPSDRPAPAPVGRRAMIGAALVVAAISAIALTIAWPRRPAASQSQGSIAVVPVLSTPAGTEVEYLADGISEGVINRLAEAGGSSLKVIALASAMRYKGQPVDPREAGRQLGVERMALLRVAHLPEGFSISAELVDVRDGTHIWGEQYNTSTTNLVGVQTEIASRIADTLHLRLTRPQQQRSTKRYTDDIEAYQLYLQGREVSYISGFGPEGYEMSLDFYERAIARDPSYALAYTGVSDTYVSLAYDGWMPAHDACEKVKESSTRALALDPDLSESHYSLTQFHLICEWDWAATEAGYTRALALNPNNATARRFHAQFLLMRHQPDAAIAEIRRAIELDPLSAETNKAMASVFFWAGRYDEAIAQARRTIELAPDFGPAHQLLADLYAHQRLHHDAIAEQQKALQLAGENEAAAELGRTFAARGYEAATRALYADVLAGLTEANRIGWVSPIAFAITYAKLGDRNQAFDWLEKAYADRSPWLVFLQIDPDFEPLRGDPRFTSLANRIRLP
jgi:serine/threonine-protein kinase